MAAYQSERGCLPISGTRAREGRLLFIRMLKLRRTYREGKLSDDLIRRFKKLGFSFEPDEGHWQKRYHELADYVSNGQNPNRIPVKNPLRGWVRNQKAYYKSGSLSQEKIKHLEKLGIAWDDKGYMNEIWQKNFRQVAEYFKENEVNVLPVTHHVYPWWRVQLRSVHILPQDKAEKIRSLKPMISGRRWSEWEKNTVRENCDKSAEELAKLLIGRTPQAIHKLRDKYGW